MKCITCGCKLDYYGRCCACLGRPRVEAEQAEIPGTDAILNGYSLAEVRIMRDALTAELSKRGPIAALLYHLSQCSRDEAAAFAELLKEVPRGQHRKLKTLRVLASYIHRMELRATGDKATLEAPRLPAEHAAQEALPLP